MTALRLQQVTFKELLDLNETKVPDLSIEVSSLEFLTNHQELAFSLGDPAYNLGRPGLRADIFFEQAHYRHC